MTTKRRRRGWSRLALLGALIADLFVYGLPALDPGPSRASLEAALAVQARVTEEWMARPGVVGTAVGFAGSGEAVLTVYVTMAGVGGLPPAVANVPVRVEVTGPFVSLADPPSGEVPNTGEGAVDPKEGFPRPVPIGVSTGHPEVTAGTLGARVTDGFRVFALSNNHVFANRNRAGRGDAVLQPGTADGGKEPEDVLATLFDFEPIHFCGGGGCPLNAMDAAIALTSTDDLGAGTPEDGYGFPRRGIREPELGLSVQKYGRTTGHTRGRITGLNATLDVNYRTGSARFTGQMVISGEGFSTGGDSGSLVVTDGVLGADRRPVGLLFAGSATTTVANPIGPVLDRFRVRIDGG